MITRKDYIDGNATHREYYAQFVNEQTIAFVVRRIGASEIRESTDPHMNDIPLRLWDNLAGSLLPMATTFKSTGDCPSLSGYVCIAKEAARQFKESAS